MDEFQFQLIRGVGAAAAVAVAVSLQRLSPQTSLDGSWWVNARVWAINVVVMGVACGACACTVAMWAEARGVGLFNVVAVSPWLSIGVTVLGLDLVSYGWHRANHQLPILWRFHQVHHSDQAFTVSTAVRFHPGELLLSLPLRLAAVVALGAAPAGIVAFEIVFAAANFFEHGNIGLPRAIERRLARICITPALHRRHHSARMTDLSRNFGTVFVFWDRLFGTYLESSSGQRFSIGLPYPVDAATLGRLFALPLHRRSLSGE